MSEPGPDDIQPTEHETLDRIATGTVSIVPFLALGIVCWQVWNSLLHWSDIAVFGILYVLTGFGVTVGFHRLFTHRSFATKPWLRGVLAVLRLGGHRGTGHLVGGRPPQAPRVRRPAGRPAQPARRSRRRLARRAARPGARAHGLALPAHPARIAQALRARPARRPGGQLRRSHVPRLGDRRPRRGVRAGLAHRRHLHRRAHRPAVGRRRAAARPAPRDLLDQLAVPLLRAPALRDRRRVAQPRVALAAVLRRGVAQQPPRLPHVRGPRDALVRDRHVEPASYEASSASGLAWDVVRIDPARQQKKLLAETAA